MHRPLALMALALFLAVGSALVSAKEPVEQVVVADTPEKFEVLVASVRAEMAPGERYEFLRGKDLETVNMTLDQMTALLTKRGSIAEMSKEELAQMMTYQEKVNGLLAGHADDRLVCTHEKPVGSHIPRTECHTVREIEANRKGIWRQKEELNDLGRRAVPTS
ncbi:hypothetical protein [Dokdonella sp.]|uniref:hypothetical protein n=1 Tax=Dokdonella sp. TaxID=2291710 RepID=UPI00352728AC